MLKRQIEVDAVSSLILQNAGEIYSQFKLMTEIMFVIA